MRRKGLNVGMTIKEYIKKYPEASKYKDYLEEREKLPSSKYVMCEALGDWHPNFPGDYVVLGVFPLRGEGNLWRVCVWGLDDFGLELDSDKETVSAMFDTLKDGPIGSGMLKTLGFNYA